LSRSFLIVAYSVVIMLLFMIVLVGGIQLHMNTRRYGWSYEVVTVTNCDTVSTQMNGGVNLGFLIFLSFTIYLLTLPLMCHIQENKRKGVDEGDENRI